VPANTGATGHDGAVQGKMPGVVAIIALAVAALAGCGDDDDASATTARVAETTTASSTDVSGADTATGSTISAADATEADYLAAIERSLSGGAGGGLTTTPEQAECMAPKWLETIGADTLKEQDIAPSQIGDDVDDDGSALSDLGLTEGQGTALYDAFGECDVDIHKKFVEFVTEDQSADVTACVTEALTPDLLRRLMVSSLIEKQPDDELSADFNAAVGPCDELAQAASTTTT
jgi:hypothetical protein